MIKSQELLGTFNINPFNVRHFGLTHFDMYVNGKQIADEGLTMNTGNEKTTMMGYRTLFEGSGIQHSDTGLQITHDNYINGYFTLLFDLTPEHSASEERASPSESGNIRVELKFDKAITDAVTCLLYLEHEGSIQVDKARNVTIDFYKRWTPCKFTAR